MKVLLLNLMLLGLSSLWMGCECDQAGGKAQGKQCKSDGGSELGPSTGVGNNGEPSSIHISQMDGQTVRLPMELSWDAVDGASYYMIRLHQPGGDCTADSSDLYQLRVEAPATSAMIDPEPMVPDGDYLLCVVAYDGSDNVLQPIQSANITIDNTGPLGMTAAWYFSDTIGAVDLEFTLPANVDDFARVEVIRSDILGPMPACSDEKRHEFTSFTSGGKLVLNDSVEAGQEGYVMNYKVCAYDVLGNVSELEITNVRTTLTVHTMFFTSTTHSGALDSGEGGLKGADDICNARGGGSNWKAIISDNSTRVVNHISMRGPVKNKLDETFARAPSQLLGDLSVSVGYDESGNPVSGLVWTGSNPDGSQSKGKNCLNWIDGTASQTGAYGDMGNGKFVGSGQSASGTCDQPKRIACISQYDVKRVSDVQTASFSGLGINFQFDYPADAIVQVRRSNGAKAVDGSCVNPSDVIVNEVGLSGSAGNDYVAADTVDAAGRYSYRICVFDKYGGPAVSSKALGSKAADSATFNEVFVTSSSYRGNMGGSDPDTICTTAASRAGLGAGWQALISDSGQNAAALLSGDSSPMVDLNSNQVASDSSAMWAQNLSNAIESTEFADLISNSEVWTGSNSTGNLESGYACANWSSTAGQGSYGKVSSTSAWFFDENLDNVSCNSFKRLYCVRN